MRLIADALEGCDMFLRRPEIKAMLPRSVEKAEALNVLLNQWFQVFSGTIPTHRMPEIESLSFALESFSTSFQDELDGLPMFTATPKGNMDIMRLNWLPPKHNGASGQTYSEIKRKA